MKSSTLPALAMPREAVLLERAARIANRKNAVLRPPGELLVLFEVEGHLAGLRARDCLEVAKIDFLTPVPDAAPGLLGLLNIQNNFHCLIDARPLILGQPAGAESAFVFAIVLRHDTLKIAVACDIVLRVESIHGGSESFQVDGRLGTLIDLPTLLAPYEKKSAQV